MFESKNQPFCWNFIFISRYERKYLWNCSNRYSKKWHGIREQFYQFSIAHYELVVQLWFVDFGHACGLRRSDPMIVFFLVAYMLKYWKTQILTPWPWFVRFPLENISILFNSLAFEYEKFLIITHSHSIIIFFMHFAVTMRAVSRNHPYPSRGKNVVLTSDMYGITLNYRRLIESYMSRAAFPSISGNKMLAKLGEDGEA